MIYLFVLIAFEFGVIGMIPSWIFFLFITQVTHHPSSSSYSRISISCGRSWFNASDHCPRCLCQLLAALWHCFSQSIRTTYITLRPVVHIAFDFSLWRPANLRFRHLLLFEATHGKTAIPQRLRVACFAATPSMFVVALLFLSIFRPYPCVEPVGPFHANYLTLPAYSNHPYRYDFIFELIYFIFLCLATIFVLIGYIFVWVRLRTLHTELKDETHAIDTKRVQLAFNIDTLSNT